jgi:hypothetical protein
MNQPWECPRCHKINSPLLMQCFCNATESTSDTCINSKASGGAIAYPKECAPSEHCWDDAGYCIGCLRHKRDVPCVGGWI